MRFLVSEKLGPHKYKTPEGYLVCVDAILSRTGTQEYRRRELFGDDCDDPDKIIIVDRKAEEVFSDKTMASFENKPICIEHPDTNVNVENHNDLSVGFVRDIHRGEDNGTPVMMGTLVITDKEAVKAVERGEYKELSCGYECDIEDEHSPQQRNIRGNHVALCKQGRAGIARIVDSVDDARFWGQQYPYELWLTYPKTGRKFMAGAFKTHEEARRNTDRLRKEFTHNVDGIPNAEIRENFRDSVGSVANDNDTKLSAKERNEISSYLSSISKFTKNDLDVIDLILPLERKGYKLFRKNIKGWYKTSDGTMRKDYFFGIKGYDNTFMISMYADEGDWKVNEVNAYFIDSANILSNKEKEMKDERLMSVNELMKYYTGKNTKWGANIFKINGKYTINPNISSRRYNTIAELEAGEEKYQAQIAKGYAPNDPNQFGDAIDDDALRDELNYYGNSWDRLVKKIVPKDKIISIGTILGRGRSAIVEGKEYADALQKATLSAGKTKVYNKPYGSYPNYFEVSFRDSAQTQEIFTVEYVKDNITHIVEIEATSLEDAILKAKDEYIADASQTQDLDFPSWTKFSNLYEHGNRDGVIERIESTGGKAKFGLPYNYLSYRTTVRMNKDGRRITSYWHERITESDAKKTIGMEITGRQSPYTSIMEWYPKGASLRFVNSRLRQNT